MFLLDCVAGSPTRWRNCLTRPRGAEIRQMLKEKNNGTTSRARFVDATRRRWFAGIWATLFLLLMANARAAQRQVLGGHLVGAVSAFSLQPIGTLPGSTNLDFVIGLPLRNTDALADLLDQLYDPSKPQYHHWLTPDEFATQFGPTEQDYQGVVDFAKSSGFTITGTHPNRTLLDVRGSVTDIEKALGVKLRVYQHPSEAREFYAPDVEPSLDLTIPILHIGGLDNYVVPHPLSTLASPRSNGTSGVPSAGSGPSGTYRGDDFRAAYAPGVSLNGAGQVVGLVEFDGYHTSDITKYESAAKLPTANLTNVLVDGFHGTPTTNAFQVLEVSLDIEMVISMAPGLREVVVYEAPEKRNPIDLLNRIATDNLARQISCSWGFGNDDTFDQVYQQYAAQGQSFFQASGDNGAFNASWPDQQQADTPYVTLVGGTTLTTGSGVAWKSETVWNWNTGTAPEDTNDASGGGISTTYLIPSWQQDLSMSSSKGSTTHRNIPDVAMAADNIYVVYNNGSIATDIGGTSIATPLWAGFAALANEQAVTNHQPALGFINPAIYAIGVGSNYTACFHDIKTGNNETFFSSTRFSAVTGYDLCTGWGTPTGSNLINALVGVTNLSFAALCRDVTTNADVSCGANVPVEAVDNGSYSTLGAIVSRTLSPPGPYPRGVTQVTLTVSDDHGNSSSCSAFVTVIDDIPPSITCSGDIVTNVPTAVTKLIVTYATPSTSDDCGVQSVICSPASGSSFRLGTTPVICTAIDVGGNTNTCTFNVTVVQGGSNVCLYTLGGTNATLAAKGGSKHVRVKVIGAGCSWSAASNDPFITITSGTNGTASGKVSYIVPGNTNTTPLSGTMTIAGQTFTVNQAAGGCTFKLSPRSARIKAAGRATTVKVRPNFSDCAWTAVSNDSFITITNGASGFGKGAVSYVIPANTSTNTLTGSITVAGQTFTITQGGVK